MKKPGVNGIEFKKSLITVTIIGAAAAVMHICFFILFAHFKVNLLMYVNIFSITFYVAVTVFSLFVNTTKNPVRWMAMIVAEITGHAVLCTLFLGVDTCFILYPLISLPICAYYLFFYTDTKNFRRSIVIFVIIVSLLTSFSVGIAEYFGGTIPTSVFVLSRKEKMVLRSTNIVFSTIMLYAFTLAFYLKMTDLVAELKASTEELQFTATHDALTGLINRRCFWERFDKMGANKLHYDIALGDLDSFKSINDTYGHGCGDLVLRSVADVINAKISDEEIACRWGGEEMVIVFLDMRENSLKRLEEIRKTIEGLELEYEGTRVHVTMTFGFADSDEIERAAAESGLDEEHSTSVRLSAESLITMADKRLYIGKRKGKNVVVDVSDNA